MLAEVFCFCFVHFLKSKLYLFKLERIQHNININILSRTVLVFSYSCFLFSFCLDPGVRVGVGGYISIHEKDRGLRQHPI